MPSGGGESVRLTVHSADDYPSGFSPDGKEILFASGRMDSVESARFPYRAFSQLYAVATGGGRPRMVTTITAEEAKYDRTGRRIVFQDRKGGESPWRKHHTSAVARDIEILDTRTGSFSKVTTFAGEDRSPVFSPDGASVYYLSEIPGSINVFRAASEGSGRPEQLTTFTEHPVRFLSMAGDGTLCFTWNGEIYTMAQGGSPRKVPIEVRTDSSTRAEVVLPVGGGATEMAVSPSGKEVAFVVRGELFATSVESGTTRRLTSTPEQERMIDFSPDGRSIAFSAEREGSWNIYSVSLAREEEDYFFNATLLDEEPLLVTDRETFQPAWSPDGKEIAYIEDRTTLMVLDLESKRSRTVLAGDRNFSYTDGDQSFEWSPDGKWFLVEFLQPHYWISQIGLVRSDGTGDVVDLTRSGYFDSRPRWMMEGKMLLWQSNRDGLQGHAKAGPTETDAYGIFFTREAWDRFRLTKEEMALLKEKEEKTKKKAKDAEEKEEQKKKEEEEEEEEIAVLEIDLDGIRERKARLTLSSSLLADAVVTPDGEKLLYLSRGEKGHDLWVTELRTKETKILAKLGSDGGSLELDKEGKSLFLLAGGNLSKVAIDSGEKSAIAVSGEMTLNAAAEREYLFEHVWRQTREKFLDPGMHGADWNALKKAYSRFLPHIADGEDFAEMLSELLGELNASHTGARFRPEEAEGADKTASLGIFFDDHWDGDGLKIAEVIERNPIITKESMIAPGILIERIDGVPIGRRDNPATLLNRKEGRYTLLSLRDPSTGSTWEERVKPLDEGELSEMLYRRWVESRRRRTEELSGGRIGYVHVRSMADSSFRVVQEEVLGLDANKEALIVDTRFNGGGDLVDDLSIFLSGREYMEFVTRDGRSIGMEPSRRWTKPSIVIASEGNYSDAHCFPWAYQHLAIGKVVGMPVAGTCSFVWWERLQDRRLVFGIPNLVVAGPDGRPLENQLLEPDIRIDNEPAALAGGIDQQLERAVAELLTGLGAH
jgi:Tol biopolymer transport system component/C-terminal processing protease CtpA/Prc